MKRRIILLVLLVLLTACNNDANQNPIIENPIDQPPKELTPFEVIMKEKGLTEYQIEGSEFNEIYSVLDLYTYNYIFSDQVKRLALDYLNAFEFLDTITTEMEEVQHYQQVVREYYSRNNHTKVLLKLESLNPDNSQLIDYYGVNILMYQVDTNRYKLEFGSEFPTIMEVNTIDNIVTVNGEELIMVEEEYVELLEGTLNRTELQIQLDDTTVTYIYDYSDQTLIERYNLDTGNSIILNTHYLENDTYIFGLTDGSESVSLQIAAFEGTVIELFTFLSDEEHVLEYQNGDSSYITFLTANREHFVDIDTILFD